MTQTHVEVPDFASMPDDDDPFAVIFVVNDSRDELGNIAAEQDILQASSYALVGLLNSIDEGIQSRLAEWTKGRIRKIVKRARASAWNKVNSLEFPHVIGIHNGVEVLAFAPMRISEQAKELKKLQVTGLNSHDDSPAVHEEHSHLEVKVNAALNMSTGKLVAQVGHAIQLFLMRGNEAEIKDWIRNGSLLTVIKAENLNEDTATGIIVHDAGFTEVPSGSLTAAAEYRINNGR